MAGNVERRALLALFRNHPATGPGDRYNWKARAEASRQREMLLGWAATLPDETLLYMRNIGPVALRWIREQTGDPPSPFADLEAENRELRERYRALVEALATISEGRHPDGHRGAVLVARAALAALEDSE